MDKIQIEPGKYTLTITVESRQKNKYLPFYRTNYAKSKVQFEVKDDVRELMRCSLKEYLGKKAYNFFTNEQAFIPLPEYTPYNVQELSK